jgi:rhodanese-related sulfurtransferase
MTFLLRFALLPTLLGLLPLATRAAPDSGAPAIAIPNAKAIKLETQLWKEFAKLNKGLHAPLIHAKDLLKIIDDTDLVLIDVRQPEEQKVSMLAHALTPQEFADKFRHGIPKGKRIVVYCTIGYRSGKYADQLALQNINAENLEGGMLAWSHIGGTFYEKDADGHGVVTNRVHVYDKSWNFLHPDYRAVW